MTTDESDATAPDVPANELPEGHDQGELAERARRKIEEAKAAAAEVIDRGDSAGTGTGTEADEVSATEEDDSPAPPAEAPREPGLPG